MSTAVATATEAPDQARVAFETLYRESRDDVYAYTAGLLRDPSAAEEITSQAFERAWRKRRQLKPERGSARAWLFGIARNAALDELRRRSRHAEIPDDAGEPSSSGGRALKAAGGDPAEVAVRRTALKQAMSSLSGRERELVALKYFAGLSNAEIAKVAQPAGGGGRRAFQTGRPPPRQLPLARAVLRLHVGALGRPAGAAGRASGRRWGAAAQ